MAVATGASPRLPAPPPKHGLDVTSFGAVGDGRTDDTAALKRAFDAVKTGQAIVLPAGKVFSHSDVLSLSTPGVSLLGPGTLSAAVEHASALKIEASNITVDGITLAMSHTTQRWSTPDQHKLFIGSTVGVTVQNVVINGSAAAGLFCLGASEFVVRKVEVNDTRADGIHMTDGSRRGTVESVIINRSGDDGVAVVSYFDDAAPCSNIRISQPTVRTTTGGRGLSVVGGESIAYENIDVDSSFAASVYIACEGGSSVTRAAHDVIVRNGVIRGANTNAAIDHGAVLVYSGRSGGDVSNVLVSGLKITQTRSTASRQIGVIADNNDPVSDIEFSDVILEGSPAPYQGNAPSAAVALNGVTANGQTLTQSR